MYDGDWVDGKREGNGKYIYEDDRYYIGQFKNNAPNGKGIEYDKNGKIIFDGNWVNGHIDIEKEQYIYENELYYIFLNSMQFERWKGEKRLSNRILIYNKIFY